MGSEYEGLISFDRNSETFSSYLPSSPKGELAVAVTTICPISETKLLVGTRSGLFIFQIVEQSFTPIDWEMEGSMEITALARKGESFFIGTRQGLFVWAENSLFPQAVSREVGIPMLHINALTVPDSGQDLWIGADQGLFYWDEKAKRIVNPPHLLWPKNTAVSAISGFKDTFIWIGTFGEGLFQFDLMARQVRNFRHEPDNPLSLSENSILSVLMSQDGAVWAGTFQEGLNLLDHNQTAFSFFPTSDLSGEKSGVNAIVSEKKHPILWFGTDNGLFRQEIPTELLEFTDPGARSGLPSVPIYSLLPAIGSHPFLVGTGGAGLLKCQQPHLPLSELYFEKVIGLQSDEILALAYAPPAGIWVGSVAGLDLWNINSDSVRNYPKGQQGLGEGEVTALLWDQKSKTMWVGTSQNLFRFNPTNHSFAFIPLRSDNPDRPLYIFTLQLDSKNRLWIGTDDGLQVLSPSRDSVSRFTISDGLPSNEIVSIHIDEGQNKQSLYPQIWVGTENGIANFSGGNSAPYFSAIGKTAGLPCLSSRPGAIHALDNLYFGCDRGLFWLNSQGLFKHHSQLQFTDFKLFNVSVPFRDAPASPLHKPIWESDSIFLQESQNHLHFEFSNLNFLLAAQRNYAYQLLGFDTSWIEAGSRHSATYTNLEPGDYVFQIKSREQNAADRKVFIRIAKEEKTGTWLYYLLILVGGIILVLIVRWNR
ncbi:MAG TPA: hypothetical protein ENJ82_15080 [Bacteroidetes bacterium]|nr:hypothetical protein [Bacteroidota bacterium]